MGEEISWGQRIFDIETPELLAEMNAQKETNLHNLVIGGTNINKLIFGKLLAVGLLCYLIPLPIMYRKMPSLRRLLDRLAVPIPQTHHTIVILAVVLLIETSPSRMRGEITEFALTALVFLLLINPLNQHLFARTSENTSEYLDNDFELQVAA